MSSGTIWPHLLTTFVEAALSFAIGGLFGVVLGFALARAPFLAAVLDPYIRIANALPRVVLAPIFLLWFGLGIWSKVALGVTVVFFIVFFNTYRGVREVDRVMIDNVRMLGATEGQLIRHVLIPSALTWIFSSLHVSIGLAIIAVVVGEYLGASRGIGYMIAQAEGVFDTTGVFAGHRRSLGGRARGWRRGRSHRAAAAAVEAGTRRCVCRSGVDPLSLAQREGRDKLGSAIDWLGGPAPATLPHTDHVEGRVEQSGRSELQEMIGAYRVSQMLAVAGRLRLADHLAAGARPVDELARLTGTHEDSLYRMLRALACFDVFAEEPGRTFRLTPKAEWLRSDVPHSLRIAAEVVGEEWQWQPWGDLLHTVTTGETAFDHVYGESTWSLVRPSPGVRGTVQRAHGCSHDRRSGSNRERIRFQWRREPSSTLPVVAGFCLRRSFDGIRAREASCSICRQSSIQPVRRSGRQSWIGWNWWRVISFEVCPRAATSTS